MPQYDRHPPLTEADVLADPIAQFQRWLEEAAAADLFEPTAMALATVGADGRPSLRMVLFKGLHEGAFCFYTNYDSRKGQDLTANPFAALTFWWDRQERQVRIEGTVLRAPRELADAYFHSRPRGSQIGALTSRQSKVLERREDLDRRLTENEARFADQAVPLPDDWGGYCVKPDNFEFWQGRRNRVHDRLVYRPDGDRWRIERLEP